MDFSFEFSVIKNDGTAIQRRRHRHLLTGRGTRGMRYRGREEYIPNTSTSITLAKTTKMDASCCSNALDVVQLCVHRSSPHDRRSRLKAQPAHAHPTGRRPSSPTPGSADAIPTAVGSQRAPQSLRSSRLVHRFFIIMVGTAPWAHTMASALPHSCKAATF